MSKPPSRSFLGGFTERTTMSVGHAAEIGSRVAQVEVLDQQEAQAAVLGAVEPSSAGEDENGDLDGHVGVTTEQGRRRAGDLQIITVTFIATTANEFGKG